MRNILLVLGLLLLPALTGRAEVPALEAQLAPDLRIASLGGALWREVPPNNRLVELSAEKPAAITREPAYRGTPRYGSIRLGNGPHGLYHVVVEHEPADQPGLRRIYIDANRNGDLTDDGDGRWNRLSRQPNNVTAGSHPLVLRASWGEGGRETSAGNYAVMFVYLPAKDESYSLHYRGTTARTGELALAGGAAKAVAIETDGDAVFDATAANPLHLWIDADRDGFFDWNERFDGRAPLALDGKTYEASFSPDGTHLALTPTTQAAQVLKERRITRPEQRVLLAAGARAPDFTALRPDGSEMKLSEFQGQVVVLDFWAPWCGPCKASMPHLDRLYQKVKDQGVTVLGLCVWDTRAAFDKWIAKPQVPTTYPLAFDPAGRNNDNQNADSIASRLYHVTGIPTFYVIDREGRVAASFVGSGEASKEGLEAALRKLGVKL